MIKLKSCGFSIVFILIAMLSGIGVTDVDESNIGDYISNNSASVADFIEDNFTLFVSEYNKASDDFWEAQYIENRETITVDDCGTKYEGVFLDFDSDHGYAVVGNDYELLDIATNGYSPFHNLKCDSLFYSVTTGYYYLLDDKYLSVEDANNADEAFFLDSLNTKSYELRDGHSSSPRFFDMTGHTGFAAIISLEF